MKFKIFWGSIFFCVANFAFCAENEGTLFEFKYKKGEKYRIISSVNEVVKINGNFDHHAEILNRISVSVTDCEGKSGFNEAIFMTSENSSSNLTNKTFSWGEEYESKFWRDECGVYKIDEKFFMPVVRDVPRFLPKRIKIGETWTAQGHEAHDFRSTFGLEKPFKVPFTAIYKYERDEKNLKVISAQYTLFFQTPNSKNLNQNSAEQNSKKFSLQDLQNFSHSDFPVSTFGFSNQTIYFDNERGQIDHYSEIFKITIDTAFGNSYEFSGEASAKVVEFESTATEKKISGAKKQIKKLGLKDVSIQKGEKGLTISIENIQFEANSSVLKSSEQEKILRIAKILSAYPENDLLITGHTALAGTEKSMQELSEKRAKSVADFLIQNGIKEKNQVFTRGLGATEPISDNSTAKGKEKNRRVEITILDR